MICNLCDFAKIIFVKKEKRKPKRTLSIRMKMQFNATINATQKLFSNHFFLFSPSFMPFFPLRLGFFFSCAVLLVNSNCFKSKTKLSGYGSETRFIQDTNGSYYTFMKCRIKKTFCQLCVSESLWSGR